MKRTGSFLICLFASMTAFAPLMAKEPESVDWSAQVVTVQQFTAKSDDGDYRLEVSLIKPAPIVEKTVKSENGNQIRYEYKGKLLPVDFSPGQNLLTGFRLFHNDKEIPIDPRHWKDVAGLIIQKSKIDSRTIPEDRESEFFAFLDSLPQPRIHPSSTGDTVLIEWQVPGEGGSLTTYRWIVDPSGKTLFHCFMPLVGC